MKQLRIAALLMLCGFFAITSCNDDDSFSVSNAVLSSAVTASSDQAGQSIVLTADNIGSTVMTVDWTRPAVNGSIVVYHTLQIDRAGNNFATAVDAAASSGLSASLSGSSLNEILAQFGAVPGNSVALEARVTSTLDNETFLSSNVIPFSATAYDPNVADGQVVLYLAEGYPDWNFMDATVVTSPNDDGIFGDRFSIFQSPTTFQVIASNAPDVVWGAGDAFDGQFVQNGAPIEIPEAGMYDFQINPGAEFFSALKQNWGVIGSATPSGWGSDTDMSLNLSTGIWSIEIPLTANEMKFRMNDDWAVNFGDGEFDGILEEPGGNIQIPAADTYTITVDFVSDDLAMWNILDSNGESLFNPPVNTGSLLYLTPDGTPTGETIFSAGMDGKYSGFDYLTTADSFQLVDPDFNNGEVWGSNDGFNIGPGQGAISVSEDGFYRIVVDISAGTIGLTKTDWAMVGPATGLGWPAGPDGTAGQDLDMTLDQNAETWTVTSALEVGEFKFRPNDRWDLFDAGNNNGTVVIGSGTGNFANSTAGTFTVTLDLSNDEAYSFTIE